jgi:Uma2 family endonuclease
MVTQIKQDTNDTIIYPDSDGKPMADNTVQFRWILIIYYNLEWLFRNNPLVFVAGDLLWYSVEGNNKIRQAPDVMVIFGVAKGDRGSYMQWREQNIPPQVVFEILSPGNTTKEMRQKHHFYETYGVEEYYLYDPMKNKLFGWMRSENGVLESLNSLNNWVSPRLGIKFEISTENLHLYLPNGEEFSTYNDSKNGLLEQQERALNAEERALNFEQWAEFERQRAMSAAQEAEAERQRAMSAEERAMSAEERALNAAQEAQAERQRAESERLRAMSAEERALNAAQEAQAERQRAESERLRAEQLAELLRAAGIEPNQIG